MADMLVRKDFQVSIILLFICILNVLVSLKDKNRYQILVVLIPFLKFNIIITDSLYF